jgi:hypothetical protein
MKIEGTFWDWLLFGFALGIGSGLIAGLFKAMGFS